MFQLIILILAFGLALIVNSLFVWVAMLITRISSSPKGLLLISLGMTLPYMVLPFLIAALVATITFFIIVPKLSTAEGFLDTLFLSVTINIMGLGILVTAYQSLKNNSEFAKYISAYQSASSAPQESNDEVKLDTEEESDALVEPDYHAAAAPGSNAMDVYGKDLSPQEIAEIERISGAPVKR